MKNEQFQVGPISIPIVDVTKRLELYKDYTSDTLGYKVVPFILTVIAVSQKGVKTKTPIWFQTYERQHRTRSDDLRMVADCIWGSGQKDQTLARWMNIDDVTVEMRNGRRPIMQPDEMPEQLNVREKTFIRVPKTKMNGLQTLLCYAGAKSQSSRLFGSDFKDTPSRVFLLRIRLSEYWQMLAIWSKDVQSAKEFTFRYGNLAEKMLHK